MKLIGYVIVPESHLSCFPPKSAQNRQEAIYIGGQENWRERTLTWRKGDFSVLDDTAMDFFQGQIV